MPRLTILVPLQNLNTGSDKAFEETLASVLQNRPTQAEVLVSHAGPYDDPYGLGEEVRFLEQHPEASLVDLLNGGLDRARGDVLHVLLPGHLVEEGWTDEAVRAFESPEVASVAPVIVHERDPERAACCGVGYSRGGSRWLAGVGLPLRTLESKSLETLGPALSAGFYRTDAVCSLEGFSREVGDALADVDLALSLHAVGYRSLTCSKSVVRTQLPPQREPASFHQGRCAELLFRRHARQLGLVSSWLAHPLTVLLGALGEIPHPGAVTQLSGRLGAWFERDSLRRYQEQLTEARDEFDATVNETLSMTGRERESSSGRGGAAQDSKRRAA